MPHGIQRIPIMKNIGTLNREDIIQAYQDQNLVINPFDESHLQPTSYDVSVSQILSDGLFYDFDDLRLEHLQFTNFVIHEYMEFPLDIIGHLCFRTTYRTQGLVTELGNIEAGWRGKLVIEVFNASKDSIIIHKGDRLATVRFERLSNPVKKGYEGRFQNFGA